MLHGYAVSYNANPRRQKAMLRFTTLLANDQVDPNPPVYTHGSILHNSELLAQGMGFGREPLVGYPRLNILMPARVSGMCESSGVSSCQLA